MVASIHTLAAFDAERERWERLYRADPRSQVFLSWPWLRAFLTHARPGWRIVVLRDGGELIAALPLRLSGAPSALLPVARQLTFSSAPVGDYQGMLCLPEREHDAVPALAAAVKRIRWDRALLSDVSDPRIVELLNLIRGEGDLLDQTEPSRCIRTELPPTWEAYTKTLGNGTRTTTVRAVNRLASAFPAFRISGPGRGSQDIDADIDALVRLNHMRWGGNLRRSHAKYGRLHRAAHDRGCFRLFVLWDGERPIAGAASYVDPVRKTYNLYQLGYDAAYAKYSPGKGVIGLAIRDAIEDGYTSFDFLRGYEEYKLAFADDVRITTHHRLTRPGLRSRLFGAIHPSYRLLKAAAVRIVYGPGRAI
jgi:CelD/BcsL family acetyltransferase involved in cellulose biosynthesis